MTGRAGRCAWCQQPLNGPSDWWCSEAHQLWWSRARYLRSRVAHPADQDGERPVDPAALTAAAIQVIGALKEMGRAAQSCSRTLGQIIADTWGAG